MLLMGSVLQKFFWKSNVQTTAPFMHTPVLLHPQTQFNSDNYHIITIDIIFLSSLAFFSVIIHILS